ncbi:glycosyltransferase family 2 protein [Photobacterium aquimaris]|uniref:Glycosyltransferase family 2 protein n=1 Tax=Photobacterium aquimaris TaxID=512643 RepID=A0A2T3IH56_9GAMM|nr:glycosyltransferase family 2 protein [Photobacterium aquimaris]OBU23620.1 glycosyl transferase family 2 [Photobacterium aquimaris]PSU26667.1 glycosyltransferase family 2 protein [Photobacterium aquimaris]
MLLTVFTPTYNRSEHLYLCYQSLLSQRFKDFEWLIIDDGSTDGTKDLIEKFRLENKINIRYIYQENSGKQAAWNRGILNARGDYFIGVDSDDALVDDSLILFFKKYIPIIKDDKNIIGIRALSKNNTSQYADSTYSIDKEFSINSWFDEFSSRIFGERIDILKTSLIKGYLYPVEDDIKFIPELWFYSTISRKYKFLYVNKYLRLFFDGHNNNRLSRSSLEQHAKGHLISRTAMLKNIPLKYFIKNPVALIKTVVRWLQCSYFIVKNK